MNKKKVKKTPAKKVKKSAKKKTSKQKSSKLKKAIKANLTGLAFGSVSLVELYSYDALAM